jgi:hypothetical protein
VNRCETCRHWGNNPASEWHSATFSEEFPYEQVPRTDRKLCGSPKITDGEVDNPEEDSASAVDCEDYHAFLQTGPKFGCIHWEANA